MRFPVHGPLFQVSRSHLAARLGLAARVGRAARIVLAALVVLAAPPPSLAGETLLGADASDVLGADDAAATTKETLWAPRGGAVFDPLRDAPQVRNFRAGFAPCGDVEEAEDRSFEGVCLGFCDLVSRWFERVGRRHGAERTYRLQPEARAAITAELQRLSPGGCVRFFGPEERPPLDGMAYVRRTAGAGTTTGATLREVSIAHPDAVKRAIMGHHFILSGITMLDRRGAPEKGIIRLQTVPGGDPAGARKAVKEMRRHLEAHGTQVLAMARCPGGDWMGDWRRLDPPHAVLLYKITRVERADGGRVYRLHVYDPSSYYAAWHGARTEFIDYVPETGALVFNRDWSDLGAVDGRRTLLWTCDLHDGHVAAESLANYAAVADVFGLGVALPDELSGRAR